MASTLDPEVLRDILITYQDTCAEVVTDFDGRIAHFVGDGFMAIFGHPRRTRTTRGVRYWPVWPSPSASSGSAGRSNATTASGLPRRGDPHRTCRRRRHGKRRPTRRRRPGRGDTERRRSDPGAGPTELRGDQRLNACARRGALRVRKPRRACASRSRSADRSPPDPRVGGSRQRPCRPYHGGDPPARPRRRVRAALIGVARVRGGLARGHSGQRPARYRQVAPRRRAARRRRRRRASRHRPAMLALSPPLDALPRSPHGRAHGRHRALRRGTHTHGSTRRVGEPDAGGHVA